jgi:hypothetical protein
MTAAQVRTVVDLDAHTFWKLAAIAEVHEMKVAEYLAEIAVVASRAKTPMDSDPILWRWRDGLTDKQIASELGLTNARVSSYRRGFGLPANRVLKHRSDAA